jgi:hypothetical protein
MKPKKRELGIDSLPEEKLATLKAAAKYFNAGLTQVICSDKDDKLLSVSVYAEDEYAEALLRFLKSDEIKALGDRPAPADARKKRRGTKSGSVISFNAGPEEPRGSQKQED